MLVYGVKFWKKGKKVSKATAVRCYQCFSLTFVAFIAGKSEQVLEEAQERQLLTAEGQQ